MLHSSSSLWGNVSHCNLFLKSIDQKKFPFIVTNNWIVLPVQFIYLYLFIKGSIYIIFCGFSLISSWFNLTVTAYWKHLSFLLIGISVAFFVFYQIRRIYIWSTTIRIYFITFIIQEMNIEDSLTFIGFSTLF